MSPFLARRQYNTPILYVGVKRIACTNIEAAPKRPWKNDLSLRGTLGLHGKTILTPSPTISQHISGSEVSTFFSPCLEIPEGPSVRDPRWPFTPVTPPMGCPDVVWMV